MSDRQNVIVWLDPGKLTGVASWDEEAGAFFSWQYEIDDLVKRLKAMAVLYEGRMSLGWEKYIITSGGVRTGDPSYSRNAISQVSVLADDGLFDVLPSMPSSSRALGSPALLNRLGWRKPGKVHANDAAQHLLAYLLKQRPMSAHVRHKLFPGYTTGATLAP